MRKAFTAFVICVVLCASSACAAVSPELALSDPRIGPYVEATKQNGAGLLPGRYMHSKELAQRTSSAKILAPTSLIMEITSLNPQHNTYLVKADFWDVEEMPPMYMALDFSGPVPILRTYALENEGQYELIAEDFAVVMSDPSGRSYGKKYLWCLESVETGEIRYMYPINAAWFPEGWYRGSWKGAGGNVYTFAEDEQARLNGQVLGKYSVSDCRIIITSDDGKKQVLFAALNPDTDNLVITFTDDNDNMTAEIFTRETAKHSAPSFPSPTTQTQPQMPQSFPEMPNVQMPAPPALNIDGVWGAYLNGQQLVTQFSGGQYFGWINGQPSEMGVVQIQGNTITGSDNKSVNFTATLQLDPSGRTLTMTFTNGNTITYQRLQ